MKPLAEWDGYIPLDQGRSVARPASEGLSWFHSSLAISGALTVLGVILGTAVFFGTYDRPFEPVHPVEVATHQRFDEQQAFDIEQDDPDSLTSESLPSSFMAPKTAPRVSKQRRTYRSRVNVSFSRPRILFAANRVRRHLMPHPQYIVSDFVPTTLIIYVEQGHIKTRIEPQLTAAYKRAPAGLQ